MASVLASVQIIDGTGICEYAYPHHLRALLRNPNIFARLNLLIQRQFDSKYSLALWEYMSGELALSGDTAPINAYTTDWISVEKLRQMLGAVSPAYTDYRSFNREVLKPAIAEINRVSNIAISEMQTQRENRRIAALRFSVSMKDVYQLPLDLQMLDDEENSAIQNDGSEKTSLIALMIDAGVAEKVARKITRAYNADRIAQNLEWANRQIQTGRDIRRPGAFVASAIRNDYVEPERVKRKRAHDARVDQVKRAQDRKTLDAMLEKLRGDFWMYRVQRVDAVLSEFTADERNAFEQALEEANAFGTSAGLEAYRKHGISRRTERALFYGFAFERLLTPEDRDIIRYAEGHGTETAIIAALRSQEMDRAHS